MLKECKGLKNAVKYCRKRREAKVTMTANAIAGNSKIPKGRGRGENVDGLNARNCGT